MLKVITYNLTPHLPPGSNKKLSAEWFREAINKLVRKNWKKLEGEKADVSLFFNHDPETGQTRIGYPLIIYHFVDGEFYLAGVNEGATAVTILAGLYKKPFKVNGILFPGFKKLCEEEAEIKAEAEKLLCYRLEKWIPVHHKEYNGFSGLPLSEKIQQLNVKLRKHIEAEFGKYLNLNLGTLHVEITNILATHRKPELFKGYKYFAFDIEFRANITLPRYITLGNNKALGYGRVSPV